MKRKRGGQPGNKNAVSHGAPLGNRNAYKHGLCMPFTPLLLRREGISLERYDEWFWGNIAKLGYTQEELESYRGKGLDGSIQLFMLRNPKSEPGKVVVYCGKTVVFDSSKTK